MSTFAHFSEINAVDYSFAFSSGKYKGIPIQVVIEQDPDYLVWMEKTMLTFVMPDEMWLDVIKSKINLMYQQRKEKAELVSTINEQVQSLTTQERNRRRRKYFAKKAEEKEE